jgi:hypothetical protein
MKSNEKHPALPLALADIANGRDHIDTTEFGQVTIRAEQTIRKNHSQTGACFGIRPVKVGGKLLWPVAEIAAMLQGEQS